MYIQQVPTSGTCKKKPAAHHKTTPSVQHITTTVQHPTWVQTPKQPTVKKPQHPSAKHSQVLLFRRGKDNQVDVKEIDLKRVLSGKDLEKDVRIQAGDMIVVPKSRISKVKEYATLVYWHLPLP